LTLTDYKLEINKKVELPTGLVIAPEHRLLAKISLENWFLTDDTDCGQLVISSCNSILFCRSSDAAVTRPKVYQALIQHKLYDQLCLLLSEESVVDMNLSDGCSLDARIQFQLDESYFSRLNEAVGRIKDAHNVPMLLNRFPCPKANPCTKR
jgi:hypothetical protein